MKCRGLPQQAEPKFEGTNPMPECRECHATMPPAKGGRMPKKCPLCGAPLQFASAVDDDTTSPPRPKRSKSSTKRSSRPQFRLNGWIIAGLVVVVLIGGGIAVIPQIQRSSMHSEIIARCKQIVGGNPDVVWIPSDLSAENWKLYREDEGLFEVEMDGPSYSVRVSRQGVTSWAVNAFRIGKPMTIAAYSEASTSGSPILNEVHLATVRKTLEDKFSIGVQREATLGRYSGIETYGRHKQTQARTRLRHYFVDGNIVTLVIMTSDTAYDLDGPEPTRFFNSLKILK